MIFEVRIAYHSPKKDALVFFIHQILKKMKDVVYQVYFQPSAILIWINLKDLQTQRLEQVIEELSKQLPYDVFMGEVSTQLLENTAFNGVAQEGKKGNDFSYCPSCLQEKQTCALCQKTKCIYDEEIFENIIQTLLENQSVGVVSESGLHCFGLKPQESQTRAYCLNLEKILELCNATENDIKALASLQKPIVRMRVNPQNSYGLQENEVDISLAQDLFLVELFEKLQAKGIDFLFENPNISLEYKIEEPSFAPISLVVLENDSPLVLKDPNTPQELQQIFKEHKHADKACLSTILVENSLQKENILNFYFSFEDEDKISLYNSQTQWFNEIMSFTLPKDTRELFEWIRNEDENGSKLIENYKNAFPQFCENKNYEGLSKSIFSIWSIIQDLLGMPKNPFYLAQSNLDKRGVAIDYICKEDVLLKRNFLLTKCVRSTMSFRLAGVQNEIIALGLIESFSLFPSRVYLSVRDLIEINGVSFCGEMFANKMIGDFFYKNNRQFPIYRNVIFPLLYQ